MFAQYNLKYWIFLHIYFLFCYVAVRKEAAKPISEAPNSRSHFTRGHRKGDGQASVSDM